MRYTVNISKARRIYCTTNVSAKVMVSMAAVFPISACIAMLCYPDVVGMVAGIISIASALAFVLSLFLYLYSAKHIATRYIELIEHIRPQILGCHARNARGSNGYDGMQEVYFTYTGASGETEEFVLGIVEESKGSQLEGPLVDITRQKIYF